MKNPEPEFCFCNTTPLSGTAGVVEDALNFPCTSPFLVTGATFKPLVEETENTFRASVNGMVSGAARFPAVRTKFPDVNGSTGAPAAGGT